MVVREEVNEDDLEDGLVVAEVGGLIMAEDVELDGLTMAEDELATVADGLVIMEEDAAVGLTVVAEDGLLTVLVKTFVVVVVTIKQ